MLESLFTGIIPLALLLALALFINVTLHELGHAIPALLLTRGDVTIYVGSFGDPYRSYCRTFGRVTFYCKYNPLLWYKGCCFSSTYDLSIDQRILCVAGGPIASLILTFISWLSITLIDHQGFFRVLAGGVFVISLCITGYLLVPYPRPFYTPSGHPVYTDTYEILRLLRRRSKYK
jgi:hypothetical protein